MRPGVASQKQHRRLSAKTAPPRDPGRNRPDTHDQSTAAGLSAVKERPLGVGFGASTLGLPYTSRGSLTSVWLNSYSTFMGRLSKKIFGAQHHRFVGRRRLFEEFT